MQTTSVREGALCVRSQLKTVRKQDEGRAYDAASELSATG